MAPPTPKSKGRFPPIQPTQHKHHPPIIPHPVHDKMFLRLPPEIRNMVYSNLLISAEQPLQPKPSGAPNRLTILGVCKQIHNEALPVFYRNNEFRLANPEALYQFLRNLSIPRRRQITNITLDDWHRRSTHATAAFKKLGQCIRLSSLKVYPAQDGLWVGGFAGIKAFRALRGLKEVAFLGDCDGRELGGEFLEGVKKGLLEPRRPCKRCERVGSPV